MGEQVDMPNELELRVDLINFTTGVAYLSDGTAVPVVSWLDDEGDECRESAVAVACVCGNDFVGWWAVDLTQFEPVARN